MYLCPQSKWWIGYSEGFFGTERCLTHLTTGAPPRRSLMKSCRIVLSRLLLKALVFVEFISILMDKSCQLIIGWDVIRESAGVTIIREVEVRVVRSPT